jgi:hypothetical protein
MRHALRAMHEEEKQNVQKLPKISSSKYPEK